MWVDTGGWDGKLKRETEDEDGTPEGSNSDTDAPNSGGRAASGRMLARQNNSGSDSESDGRRGGTKD